MISRREAVIENSFIIFLNQSSIETTNEGRRWEKHGKEQVSTANIEAGPAI